MAMLRRAQVEKALEPGGFSLQATPGEWTFIRASAIGGVYERIELSHTMATGVLVFGVALSAVRDVRTQFKGLIERDGWEDLCTDRENGRVALDSGEAQSQWIRELVSGVPERFSRLRRERADALLTRTAVARASVEKTFENTVGPALCGQAQLRLDEPQTSTCALLATAPFAIGCEDLRPEYEMAIAALVINQDPDVTQLASIKPARHTASAQLDSMLAVPHEPIWKIRLLTDRIISFRQQRS